MICVRCGQRYASYPEADYVSRGRGKGMHAKTQEARIRREEVYGNNASGDCGCDKQDEWCE